MSIILKILGALFLIYGAILSAMSNVNFGVIMVWLLGAFFLLWGIFYTQISSFTGVMKWMRWAVSILIMAEIGLVGFLAVYGMNDNVSYDEEAVVVLGAAVRGERITLPLKYRLDSAIEYSRKNPDAVIVVTGGQGFQESVTEAYAMEKYLIENGVEEKRIIKEERATSTNENMRFSREILDGIFEGEYEIAVITNDFHVFRGVSIAKIEGFRNVSHAGAKLQWYNLLPCYLRESLAVLKMWILG